MPAVKQLLDDPRYKELNWEGRQIALQRFAETDDGKKYGPEVGELGLMEKLRYFSENGTKATRDFNSEVMGARFDYGQDRKTSPIAAESAYKNAVDVASSNYRAARAKRAEDLFQAGKLNEYQKTTELSFGTAVADVLDVANPFAIPTRIAGKDTAHEARYEEALEGAKETTAYLQNSGYGTVGDIQNLQNDAMLHENAGGAPAAVDSYGEIAINDGIMMTNIKAVYEAIDTLDAPEAEKTIARNSLEMRKQALVENTWEAAARADMVDTDDNGGGTRDVSISGLFTLGKMLSATNPVSGYFLAGRLKDRAETGAHARANLPETHTYAEKERAVSDWVAGRDGNLERLGIGFSTGATVDVAQMFATPLEILGVGWAKDFNDKVKEDSDAHAGADRLANLGKDSQIAEVIGRVIPQVLLTRGVGGAAGGLVKGTTAADNARRAAIATRFAIGFGGLQSATFNARSVLDNGGSEAEATYAGLAGFATTFLISSGFSKVGLGGAEQFHAKAAANANAFRSGMLQRMANITTGAVGEGVEEFVDEFVNGMITADATGANPEDIVEGALIGGLVGLGSGGVIGGLRKPVPTLKKQADQAMEEMKQSISNPESAATKQRAANASRIVDLRDKADTDAGLTEGEVIELSKLEDLSDIDETYAKGQADIEYLGTKQEEILRRLRELQGNDTILSSEATNAHITQIHADLLAERDAGAPVDTVEATPIEAAPVEDAPLEADEEAELQQELLDEVEGETLAEPVSATEVAIAEEVQQTIDSISYREELDADEEAELQQELLDEVEGETLAEPVSATEVAIAEEVQQTIDSISYREELDADEEAELRTKITKKVVATKAAEKTNENSNLDEDTETVTQEEIDEAINSISYREELDAETKAAVEEDVQEEEEINKSDPSNMSYAELQRAAFSINQDVQHVLHRGGESPLAGVQGIALNVKKEALLDFVTRYAPLQPHNQRAVSPADALEKVDLAVEKAESKPSVSHLSPLAQLRAYPGAENFTISKRDGYINIKRKSDGKSIFFDSIGGSNLEETLDTAKVAMIGQLRYAKDTTTESAPVAPVEVDVETAVQAEQTSEFLAKADQDQTEEYTERVVKGEEPSEVILDIKTADLPPIDNKTHAAEEAALEEISEEPTVEELTEAAPSLVARAVELLPRFRTMTEWAAAVTGKVSTKLSKHLATIWNSARTLAIGAIVTLSPSTNTEVEASVETLSKREAVTLAAIAPESVGANTESSVVTTTDAGTVDANVESNTTVVVTEAGAVSILESFIADTVAKGISVATKAANTARATVNGLATDYSNKLEAEEEARIKKKAESDAAAVLARMTPLEKADAINKQFPDALSVMLPVSLQQELASEKSHVPVINRAIQFLGEEEGVGNNKNARLSPIFKMFGVSKSQDSYPWCAAFTSFVLTETGKATKIQSARAFLKIGRKTTEPKAGDVVVMWNENEATGYDKSNPSNKGWGGHAGIYLSETESHINVISGNVGDAVTVTAFPKNRVLGYRDVGTSNDTIVLHSMILPDPVILLDLAKSIYSGAKSAAEFSSKMIKAAGTAITSSVGAISSTLASNQGNMTEDEMKNALKNPDTTKPSESEAQKKADPVGYAEDMNDAAEQELLDIAGVQAYRADRGDGLLKRLVHLPYSKVKEIASKADGTDGTVFGKILGVPVKWVSLGITSKAAAIKSKKFYTDAQAALQLGIAMASPTAQAEVDPLRAHFRDSVFQYNPDGTVVGVEVEVTPFEKNGVTVTTSSHDNDIIEAVIANPADARFSPELREFVAELVALRDHTLRRAGEAGVAQDQLFGSDSTKDYSKLKDGELNTYSPRGPVSDSRVKSSRASGSARKGSARHTHKRQYSSVAEGVANGAVYEMASPFDRIQNFVEETNNAIAMENFRRDPDIVKNQEPLAIEMVTEYEPLDVGDANIPVPVIKFKQTKRSKLADTKISLGGGKSFNYRNDDSADIQDVFNGFIRPSNSKLLNRNLKRLGVLKGLRLVLDASFLNIQLFGLSRSNPIKWAKTVGKSFHSLIDGDQVRLDFLEKNVDLVQSYVKSGGMYTQRVDELLSIQTRTSSKLRKNTIGRLEDSMMNALMIGSMYQFESLRATHLAKGTLTEEMDASFARMADRSVGREDMTRNGVSYDKQLWMRTAGTAPSMYAAFVNGIADLASSDPVVAKAAWKGATRMGIGTTMAFLGKSLAAAFADEDDLRTAEEVISDSAKRMLPWQKDFMRIDVPIGNRYTIVSEGGFYRGFFKFIADFGAAVGTLDVAQAAKSYTSFLNSKKAPGLATILELYTGEDYFGNEISKTETIMQSITPVSVEALREKVVDVPVMTLLGAISGTNIRSNTNINTKELSWDETLRQTAFGLVGTSNFLESEARSYKRQLDNESRKQFGAKYADLTPQQQFATVSTAEENGLVKPDYTGDIGRYRRYLQSQFEKNTRNPKLSVFLIENGLLDKIVSTPKSSITFKKGKPAAPIPSEQYKDMVKQYHSEIEEHLSTPEARAADPKDIGKFADTSWKNILRSKDYH